MTSVTYIASFFMVVLIIIQTVNSHRQTQFGRFSVRCCHIILGSECTCVFESSNAAFSPRTALAVTLSCLRSSSATVRAITIDSWDLLVEFLSSKWKRLNASRDYFMYHSIYSSSSDVCTLLNTLYLSCKLKKITQFKDHSVKIPPICVFILEFTVPFFFRDFVLTAGFRFVLVRCIGMQWITRSECDSSETIVSQSVSSLSWMTSCVTFRLTHNVKKDNTTPIL